MKNALVTGITGQDGIYLSEILLKKGYQVYGITRDLDLKKINGNIPNYIIQNSNFELIKGDLSNQNDINMAVKYSKPHEFYNLGAQTFIPKSWENPAETFDITGMGALRCLEAIRIYSPTCRFFQAGSSEVFGKPNEEPQTENTIAMPFTPYGYAKNFAQQITKYYRDNHNIFACTGILFSHESPRRRENFVTRKVTLSVAKIKLNLQDSIQIGNINSKRDWGFSGDFVNAFWMMLQQEIPRDMIISTGITHSVKDLLEISFKRVGINLSWSGSGIYTTAHDDDGLLRVSINEKYYRHDDHKIAVRGSYEFAKRTLGWEPKIRFHEMITEMVDEDVKRLE